jgi:serine/threonine protein kinase
VTVSRSIGRYLLEDLTSCGGMGEVWKARDEMLGRLVAVKLLYSKADDVQGRARFLREARTAARLVHPNVVPTTQESSIATSNQATWSGRTTAP